jgi:hypothetical protein
MQPEPPKPQQHRWPHLPFWSRSKDAGDVPPEQDPGEGPPVDENLSAGHELLHDQQLASDQPASDAAQPASDAAQAPGETVTEDGAVPADVSRAAGEAVTEDSAVPADMQLAAGAAIHDDQQRVPGEAAAAEETKAAGEAAAAEQAQAQAKPTSESATSEDAARADHAEPPEPPEPPGPPAADSGAARAAEGKDQPAGDLGERAERAVADRPGLPAAAQPALRQQLAEFVELSHRLRVPSLAGRLALDPGESITTTLVKAMAFVIRRHVYPGSPISQEQLTEQLMRILVVPGQLGETDDMQLTLPLAISHGRISLDVSAALAEKKTAGSPQPRTRLVRAGDRPELCEPLAQVGTGSPARERGDGDGAAGSANAEDEGTSGPGPAAGSQPGNGPAAANGAGGETRADAGGADGEHHDDQPESRTSAADSNASQAPEADSADAHDGGSAEVQSAVGTAALIWGPAAAIADGRRYLSTDALMSYARTQAFDQLYRHSAATAAQGMRAVRGLEVVVLLDKSIGGGLWIDVDPETGCASVALAIEVLDIVSPNGIRVTRLPGL